MLIPVCPVHINDMFFIFASFLANTKLEEIYKEIDALEKSKIEVHEFSRKSEEFMPFALLGIVFLIASLFFRVTIFRSIP